MEIDIFHVDAFTDRLFTGNPAAVCPLEDWLPDDIMQAIANENNLSETAFIVPRNNNYHIRWFSPLCEIELCGHATLAAAHVIFNELELKKNDITFYSQTDEFHIHRDKSDFLAMNFPAFEYSSCDIPDNFQAIFGDIPTEIYQSNKLLAIFKSEKQIRDLNPNFELLVKSKLPGIIVSAKGDHVDFVSRYFNPKTGVSEDPVTGSAHCILTPYWSEHYGKTSLHAKQLSKRQGEIFCELQGNRVILKGKVISYMKGKIKIF